MSAFLLYCQAISDTAQRQADPAFFRYRLEISGRATLSPRHLTGKLWDRGFCSDPTANKNGIIEMAAYTDRTLASSFRMLSSVPSGMKEHVLAGFHGQGN